MTEGCGSYEQWRRQAEALLRRMAGVGGFDAASIWSPPTDVFETEEGVVVKMELPGVRPEDVSIVLLDDRLIVKGRRDDPDAGRKIHYQQMEIAYGPFAKVVLLRMHFDRDGVRARLKDGYLDLTIPRASEPIGEKIVVEIKL